MATNYPSALDNGTSLPYPTSTDDLSSPNLAAGQGNQNDATIAVETLVGTNATQTTPTASGNVLQATSTTASEWGLLTSSNVSASTGTGDFVFATSPTLTSPTINTPTITSPSITGSLGNISTGTISASGATTLNSTLAVTGVTTLTGLLTANGGITVPTGQTLVFPNGNYPTNRSNNGTTITETAANIQTGWIAGTVSTANNQLEVTVTFPVAFTNPPIVVCIFGGDQMSGTIAYGTGSDTVQGNVSSKAVDITTTGCHLWAFAPANWAAGNILYWQWIAIGT